MEEAGGLQVSSHYEDFGTFLANLEEPMFHASPLPLSLSYQSSLEYASLLPAGPSILRFCETKYCLACLINSDEARRAPEGDLKKKGVHHFGRHIV
jgi:hypothetical protein